MAYFIVDLNTGKEYKEYHWSSGKVYDSERGAKVACTRMNNKGGNWSVMECGEWNVFKGLKFPTKMVTRKNMMTGKDYVEAEDTPTFMSPSSESYWSM